jgi:hypothetical protein
MFEKLQVVVRVYAKLCEQTFNLRQLLRVLDIRKTKWELILNKKNAYRNVCGRPNYI